MLHRESLNLEAVKYRIHRMQKDEKLQDKSRTDHIGSTLLEKVRAEDAAAANQAKN